jgi:Phosphoesterase family
MDRRVLVLAVACVGVGLLLGVPAASARRRSHIGLSVSTHIADLGQRIAFRGHVRPNHSGDLVWLEQRLGRHHWRRIGHARLGRRSKFGMAKRFHKPAALRLRVAFARPRDGSSDSKRVTVLPVPVGIHRIKHVVVIMQENRSFDSFFGTFPGADGLPPGVCVPDPHSGTCVAPYHEPNDLNHGGPHGAPNAVADLAGGQMSGFIAQAEKAQKCQPDGTNCATDVMGYHDAREIPNYWDYARDFVLQDHMFEPNASWSLPEHLFLVSNWSALCSSPDPFSCVNALQSPIRAPTCARPPASSAV